MKFRVIEQGYGGHNLTVQINSKLFPIGTGRDITFKHQSKMYSFLLIFAISVYEIQQIEKFFYKFCIISI